MRNLLCFPALGDIQQHAPTFGICSESVCGVFPEFFHSFIGGCLQQRAPVSARPRADCAKTSRTQSLAHRNRSEFCELRCPSRTPEIASDFRDFALRVRWKVASDVRFRVAISEPQTPSFCGISCDLAPSMRKSLAIAIVRFWCAKTQRLWFRWPHTRGPSGPPSPKLPKSPKESHWASSPRTPKSLRKEPQKETMTSLFLSGLARVRLADLNFQESQIDPWPRHF